MIFEIYSLGDLIVSQWILKLRIMFPNPEIFGIQLNWYTLWQWLAIIVTSLFALIYIRYNKTLNISISKLIILICCLIFCGYPGAKILSAVDYFCETGALFTEEYMSSFSIMGGGLRMYGGLLSLLLITPVLAKILAVRKWSNYLDFIVLLLCLFTAIVKQACFFSGDGCYGVYTNLPWGMYFPYGEAPNMIPVHPTPLYDTIFHLILFAILLKLNKKKTFDGQVTVVFFVATALFNILIEFIRRNPEVMFSLTLSQLTYFLIIFITMIYYLKFRNAAKSIVAFV